MAQIDIVENNLLTGSTIYNDLKDQYTYLLESYMGGQNYREGAHLTRYQLESGKEYGARLNQTHLDNHCKSVISVYNSFLFRVPPTRDLGTLDTVVEQTDFLNDADFDGRSLNNFMKDVATWAGVFGSCWIILCKPNIGSVTAADELYNSNRPYANIITPLSMLKWNYQRLGNGAYQLDYIKYIEDINGNVRTVKEWTLDTITTTTIQLQQSGQENVINRTEEPNGLGAIPAICCYNNKGLVRGLGISDINDIADAQKSIYNLLSELEETIRLDSHPSLVQTPDVISGNGAGSIIQIPENLDPNLKPYLLQYSGASVDSILNSIDRIVESIDKMANIGGVRAQESKTLSGVAMQTEFQLLNARLAEKADNLELCEEQLFEFFAQYYNRVWDGTITYPGSFNIQDTQNEFAQLKTARETATDPGLVKLIDERLVEMLGEDPDTVLSGIVPPTV
tara:strand:+ start:1171 stop:2526 length:1356 start_codon:yes stop_codon:yes gene_type:complete